MSELCSNPEPRLPWRRQTAIRRKSSFCTAARVSIRVSMEALSLLVFNSDGFESRPIPRPLTIADGTKRKLEISR
jgi:hypothetical protein